MSIVFQHLDVSAACGFRQFTSRYCVLLIKPVLGGEVDDVLVVVTIIGYAALRIGLHHAKVELARGELRAHHIDTIGDDLVGSSWHAFGLELTFSSEIELDGLDGGPIKTFAGMPEIEIEVVAHVSLRLAGTLDDILFCFICASHDRCGSQWIIIVKAAARLIQPLRHRRVRRIVDGLAVDVVEQYDAVAREAEALGERYAHQGADRLTASHDIKILGFIQADVTSWVLQYTT